MMKPLKRILILFCTICCLNSCRVYSTGHTQIASTEKIEVSPAENSQVTVKIENFSASDIYILNNSDKISLTSKNIKKIKLKTGDKLVVYHENTTPLEIQLRCFMPFKNRATVTRGKIND